MNFRAPLVCEAIKSFIDAVIPPRRSERVVNGLSREELDRIAASVRRSPYSDTSYILPYRDETVRALVWELKYRKSTRATELAAELLSEEVLGLASEELSPPVLIPVPMHATRRRERGYNQTELVCAEVSLRCNGSITYAPHALMRVRLTSPQQGLPRAKRLTNIRNAMEADARLVRGRVCIVVDDVTTTGATLHEAGRALRAAGASAVHLLALAG